MNTNKPKLRSCLPIFIFMMMAVLFFACEKSDAVQGEYVPKPDTLMPAYTDTGAEVIAFRVNNRIVISEDRVQRTRGFTCGYFEFDDSGNFIFYFDGGYTSTTRCEGIRIQVEHVSDTGTYFLKELNSTNYNQGQYYTGKIPLLASVYNTTDLLTGNVHIKKLDTIKKIVAGTFEFYAKRVTVFAPEDDSLSVTDGIFDMTY